MTDKPVRPIDDFRAVIESETFVRLTDDALQRIMVKISHHLLTPDVIADVTLITQAGQLLRDNARAGLSQTAAGMVAARRLAQGEAAMSRAAATMVRCAALQRLVAAYMIEAAQPWHDDAGTLISPPTAKEWGEFKHEFEGLRRMYAELEQKCDDSELIVTKQTVRCECYSDDNAGKHNRCTLCDGTGTREIEIARNKPIINEEQLSKIADTTFRTTVEQNGWNPTPLDAYIAGVVWGAGYNGEG
jgi:hypothetical protein